MELGERIADEECERRLLHFKLDEFKCPCCGVQKMDYEFLLQLDELRNIANTPFKITSGYRCPKHDKEIGGKGEHTIGMAVDITCRDSKERYSILWAVFEREWSNTQFTRIGIGKDFIHLGASQDYPMFVVWNYY